MNALLVDGVHVGRGVGHAFARDAEVVLIVRRSRRHRRRPFPLFLLDVFVLIFGSVEELYLLAVLVEDDYAYLVVVLVVDVADDVVFLDLDLEDLVAAAVAVVLMLMLAIALVIVIATNKVLDYLLERVGEALRRAEGPRLSCRRFIC